MANVVKISKEPKTNLVDTAKIIGHHIKYQRTKLGLRSQDVADFCNINPATLRKIENGNPRCHIGNILSITNMLGLKITIEAK